MINGWIKLHREITDHWVWDCEFSTGQAWVDLLCSASHKSKKLTIKGQLIHLDRGDQARSEVTLAKTWKWSRNRVRRFLKNLENDGMIERKTTHLTSIISICNYDTFQGDGTTDGTAKGQQTEQQKDNRRNTNKNVKNNKNEKEDILSPNDDAISVINHLNSECGTSYKTSTKATLQVINARLKEGFTVDDLKAVVTNKAKNWKDDPKMSEYLRPATLFQASKFESYLISAKSEVVKSNSKSDDFFKGML